MTEEQESGGNEEKVLQQQFMRAVSSFEGIILSQIDIKNKLADRLNYAIRAGLIILGMVAISILILLLTLSSQINRISGVVSSMNQDFTDVSVRMRQISGHMAAMERRVALLGKIEGEVGVMQEQMQGIAGDMESMQGSVGRIGHQVSAVRTHLGGISVTMDRMDAEVLNMGVDVHRMGRGARSFNRMVPLP